ncbi:MAG: hypothetical protein ABMB14_37110 [Myxococcota bacterium]
MTQPALSVLVLTEDGSDDAHATLVALLKKLLRRVDDACRTDRIRFDPQGEAERRYTVANAWKGDGPSDRASRAAARFRLIDLYRTIATRLLEQDPPGFVVFHLDGDTTWSNRHTSENVQKFSARIVHHVELLVEQRDPTRAASAMDRLLPLVPFYSIEAWLYQNLSEMRGLCAALGDPPELVAQIGAWTTDRASLDEVAKIKDQCRLSDRHNRRLAEAAWPAADAEGAGRSFHAAVVRFRGSAELRTALAATHGS